MNKVTTAKSIQYMVIATLFFSLMELGIKLLPRIPTQQVVFFRAWVTLLLCFSIMKFKGIPLFGQNKTFLWLRGFFGTVALILYFYSLKNLPLASAVAIQKLSPLFTIFFAQFFLQEKVPRLSWVFFFLAICGALLLKGFSTNIPLIGFFAAFVAAIFSGLAYNCIGILKKTEHPYTIMFYFPFVTLPLITPSTIANWVSPDLFEWTLLIGIGIVIQFAQYFMTLAFTGPATAKVSIVYYLGTVLAVVYGHFFFNEKLKPFSAVGIGLILFAVISNSLI